MKRLLLNLIAIAEPVIKAGPFLGVAFVKDLGFADFRFFKTRDTKFFFT